MHCKKQGTARTNTIFTENPQNIITVFKRTALFREKSSPSKSDSSITKFFVKQVKGSLNDPKIINKISNKNSSEISQQQKVLKKSVEKRNKNVSEIDKYQFLSKRQSKMIEQLSAQVNKYRENYKILEQKYKALQNEKNLADEKILKLQQQINNQNNHYNPINRIKNSKFLDKNLKVQNSFIFADLQKQNQLQKQLFEAKQTIKRMNLEIDCTRMKAHNQLQKQKMSKSNEYSQLKAKYNSMLNEYSKIRISKRISKGVEKIVNKISHESANQDILSISSGD